MKKCAPSKKAADELCQKVTQDVLALIQRVKENPLSPVSSHGHTPPSDSDLSHISVDFIDLGVNAMRMAARSSSDASSQGSPKHSALEETKEIPAARAPTPPPVPTQQTRATSVPPTKNKTQLLNWMGGAGNQPPVANNTATNTATVDATQNVAHLR